MKHIATEYRYDAVPLASDRDKLTVATVAAVNVTDAQAAQKAHELLTQTPELLDFCNEAFDDVDPHGVRRACATLILCQRADAQHQSTEAIPGDRDPAWELLADHLSPAGLAALQRTLHGHAGHDKFATYLAAPDWLCLAGRASRRQGDTNIVLKRYAQAAEDYRTAAEAFRQVTGRTDWAANAYFQAADALRWDNQPGLAAETYEMAAGIYAQGNLGLAAKAYSSGALAHQGAGKPLLAAAACSMSGELHMMHAEALGSEGAVTLARDAYTLALQGFMTAAEFFWDDAQCELQAMDAEKRAANALMRLGRHGEAADRFTWLAHRYKQLNLRTLAEQAHGLTAQAYWQAAEAAPGDQHELAADLYWQAARFYRQAHLHALAKAAYESAAKKYLTAAQTLLAPAPTQLTDAQVAHVNRLASAAYGLAARIYAEAGLHTQAAQVHLCVAQLHMQANSPVEAAHAYLLSAGAHLSGAEAYRAGRLHQEAEQAYETAAKAYERAAQAYWMLLQVSWRGGWLQQAAEAWWTAAKAYSEAGQHALAARACRKTADAFTAAGQPEGAARAAAQAERHDARATQPRINRAGMVRAITEEIAARLTGLKNGLLIASCGITLNMVEAQDALSMDDFDPEAPVEWLAFDAGDENIVFHLVTALTVATLIKKRHPILRRPLKEKELLGGYDFLELLRAAPLDQPDAREAASTG